MVMRMAYRAVPGVALGVCLLAVSVLTPWVWCACDDGAQPRTAVAGASADHACCAVAVSACCSLGGDARAHADGQTVMAAADTSASTMGRRCLQAQMGIAHVALAAHDGSSASWSVHSAKASLGPAAPAPGAKAQFLHDGPAPDAGVPIYLSVSSLRC